MMFKLQLVALFVLVVVCQSRKFNNPLFDTEGRPKVIKYNNTYCLVTDNYRVGPHFPIRLSTDLESWTNISYMFAEGNFPPWIAYYSTTLLDGYLYYDKMTFYAFFVARENYSEKYQIGVAKSSSVEGPYIPEPKPLELAMTDVFQPVILQEPNNEDTYLIWHHDGTSTVWGQKIYLENLTLTEGGPTQLLTPMYPWEDSYISEPSFFYRNNYFYIFYTADCCGLGVMGVARSKFPLGPYDQLESPLLTANASWSSVVEDIDGSSSVILYEVGPVPAVVIASLVWGSDDWPSVSFV